MITVFANFGIKALWLLYLWLISGIACSWLAKRKGFGERPGLATGLLLSVIGIVVWVIVPARPNSDWKTQGALPRRRRRAVGADSA